MIFRLSQPEQDKIRLQAAKIANPEVQTMGGTDWTYDKAERSLNLEDTAPNLETDRKRDVMEGTLSTMPGNVLFRKIHLERVK